jgi:putative DNA primase/helicase
VGRRFVTAIETNEGVSLNEARVKALTGCDPITARFLFQNEFTFRPVAKFWLAVNHKPRISDDSHGFWRRICLIPFLRKFKGSEIDKKLSVKLKAEAAGILAWAVRGALLWQKEGLNPPEIVVNATREYQQESDALAGFIDECCILGPDYKVKAGEIFKAYQSWCEDQGMNPRERLSSRTFGERLGTRFSKKKENKGVFYFGIGLLSNPQEDSTNFDFERESEGCEGSCTDNAEPRHHEEQHGEGSANSIHTMHTLHQDDQDGEYEEFEL